MKSGSQSCRTQRSRHRFAELKSRLPEFCRRHGVARLEVFGSIARGEARAGSDVDLLVTFRPEVHHGLNFFALQGELELMLGCGVDLLTRRSVEQGENPIRRRSILESACEIYADQAARVPARHPAFGRSN